MKRKPIISKNSLVKFLIIQHFSLLNKGDHAIFEGIISSLESKFSNLEIFCLSTTPKEDALLEKKVSFLPDIPPEIKISGIAFSVYVMIFSLISGIFYRLSGVHIKFLLPSKYKDSLEAYYSCDIVIASSNDQLSETYGDNLLIKSLYQLILALIINKGYFLYAKSVGPIRSEGLGKFYRFLTKILLRRSKAITLRESISLKFLAELNIKDAIVVPEPSFTITPSPIQQSIDILAKIGILKIYKPLFCIAPRYRSFSTAEKYDSYIEILAKLSDLLIDRYNGYVIFLPQSVRLDFDNDIETIKKIVDKLKNQNKISIIDWELLPKDMKGLIGLFNLVISTRGTIVNFCIDMSTPVIGIDYTNSKILGFMKQAGIEEFVCSWEDLSFEKIEKLIVNILTREDEIKKRLDAQREFLKQRAYLPAKILVEILNEAEWRKLK